MALAVAGIITVSWLSGVQHNHDVAVGSSIDGSSSRKPKLPDTLEMTCSTDRLDVPIASIGTRSEGLHVHIVNKRGLRTDVWIINPDAKWSTGRFSVSTGSTDLVLSTPPGTLTVGCDGGVSAPQRQVDLVDADHHYRQPKLSCTADVQVRKGPFAAQSSDMPTAARRALADEDLLHGWDKVRPYSGYADAVYDTHTRNPMIEVRRRSETVALIYLTGTVEERPVDGQSSVPPAFEAPWTGVARVQYCPSLLSPPGGQEGRSPS
jgi:hypothetical protein